MNRRVKIISVHSFILGRLLTDKNTLPTQVTNGIPLDATILSIHPNHTTNCVELIVEHPSFDEVPSGQLIPHLAVEFNTSREEEELKKITFREFL